MSKKSIFFCCALAAAGSVYAQKLAEGYIKMPDSGSLNSYVNAWDSGKGTIMVDGAPWEDEEFFISRVKPRARFFDIETQVRPDLTQWSESNQDGTDKRYLNWVPINDPAFNAIPNGTWDQEVFSMWSYVDHYGDWTSPFGWVPGAFSDVAHKNGVAASGVASVPNASIGSWATTFEGLVSAGSTKVGDFLYYHGVDGLGYNSEWTSGWSPRSKGLTDLHANLMTYMAGKNPLWECIWYNGVTDGGSCSFDYEINQNNAGELMKGTSMFMNYNWNNPTKMTNGINFMKNTRKRSPFFIYAGMDQQGSQPKSGENYSLLRDYQYSIGIWGAHSHNMFWEGRGGFGSTVEATQAGYLDKCERWYTGGSHNPAIKQEIKTIRSHHPVDSWAGISSMVSERSVLNWEISSEPFYTFFNLGNGKFFNMMGDRVSDNEWYSIGIQDYLPTWRYWFAPTWKGGQGEGMSGTLTAADQTMNATFTWDDAYFGGSCLKVTGSGNQYLHLFKSDFQLPTGTIEYTFTYKILGGKADIKLVLDGYNASKIPVKKYYERDIVSADGCAAIEDVSYKPGKDGWTTVTLTTTSKDALRKLRMIGLHFENAENLEMLIGGMAIQKEDASWPVPSAPVVKSAKVLNNTYTGVDGKIIWEMPGKKALPTPTYNSDVNTQFFKVYAQEEGGEPTFVGATTSWAAIAFRAPNTDPTKKIRFGVSAVGIDYKSESDITWSSEYYAKGSYTASGDIEINKTIIKPDESFKISYVDQKHESSTWTLVDAATGNTVKTGSGTYLEVSEGLPQGGYDLYIDKGSEAERFFGYYVQITPEASGAMPELYTISNEGKEVSESDAAVTIELVDQPQLSYTGRKADGSASRCLALSGRYIGANVGDLGLKARKSVSIAGWFKFNAIPDKTWNFMNISNKGASWPQNTWGWCWNHGDSNGQINCAFRGAASDSSSPGELHYSFPDTYLQAGIWTHIAFVCEYGDGTDFRCMLYINGVKQRSEWEAYTFWNPGNGGSKEYSGTTDEWCPGRTYPISNNDDVYFGGAAHMGSAIDGFVDDFQVWDKAMTEDDVKLAMNGITSDNIPSGLVSLWDFESEPSSDNTFTGFGSKSVKAASYDWLGDAQSSNMQKDNQDPVYQPGCPFLAGTAYPVVTTATWTDADDRRTQFTKVESRAAVTEGEAGSATVKFRNPGDHNVSVTLANNYGEATKTFPKFIVKEGTQGIDGITEDGGELTTYTVDNILFLEFAADGRYDIEVYNAAGMLVGAEQLNAVAGQNARITLGAAGVYLVKASLNGQLLRTVKVLSK